MSDSITSESGRNLNGDSRNAESVHQTDTESQDAAFSRAPSQQSAGGFYSAAAKAIEKMPNRMDSEAFIKYLKNNGVKDEEIRWSGIEDAIDGKGSITKTEAEAALKHPELEKKIYSGTVNDSDIAKAKEWFGIDDDVWNRLDRQDKVLYYDEMMQTRKGNKAKYEQYSIQNIGENYREELTKYPESIFEKSYQSSHWQDKNVLYHVRKQDTVIDGEKTLLIEEIQSDWHQAGRQKGYQQKPKELSPNAIEMQKLNEKSWNGELTDAEKERLKELKSIGAGDELVNRIEAERSFRNAIPQAPYSKNWYEKALKDQIDEAVQNGYDRVAWVDGKTSADRYSLSKSVDRLIYNKDVGVISGYKNGEEVLYKSATDKDLTPLIGKDPAKKLMESEVRPGIYEIKGEALDIGGDGMKGFYDKILPEYARKYVKKWGASVEKKTLSDGTEVWSFPVTKEMKSDVGQNGQALYAHSAGLLAGVGEDENGDMTFDPARALLGMAGVSMIASKTVRSAVAKIAARAEKMSDAAARNLVIATIKAADTLTAKSITKAINTIKKSDLADYIIGHKIYGMKDYMKLREEALRSANTGMEEAARLHLQLRELSSEAREAMYAYMTGEKGVNLSPALKSASDTFVSRIDKLGQTMVDEGFLSKEAYEEWKGQYLHRRYASKIKQARDWASGRGEFAVDKIQMRGHTWTANEDEYKGLLDSGMIGKVSEGKVEVLDDIGDGTYKLRRDWTKEERAAMGEIRDVAYALPETIGRLNQLIEFGSMLRSVSQKYILNQEGRSEKVMSQLGYVKLSGSRYGALNGKWVNKSIANDLKRISNDVMGDESVSRLWSDYITAMKLSHTVYNPTGHVNNIGSNIFLQAAAGLNPVKTLKYAAEGANAARKFSRWKELDALRTIGMNAEETAELARLESDSDLMLWKELSDKHMFGRSGLNEMLRTYMSPHIDMTAGSALHKVGESVKAVYQGEDDVMRFAAIKQLTNDGLWSETENGMERLRMNIDEAMSHVNSEIVPDYTKPMSKLALTLRDSGLVPFMSWTYYSTPILIKQLRNHPARVMGIIGSWYAMDRLFGVDPMDEEGVPKGWADQRVAIGRDGDKVTGLRVSSMIPHIQLATPENTFLEPLTSGIPQTLLGEATNYNFYFRKPITQKEGSEGTYHRVKDAVQNALPTPDALDKLYNIAEAHMLDKETRRRDRVIEPRTPTQEAASMFVNLQTYDEGNQRRSYRKDRTKEKRHENQWSKKVGTAMSKMERVFQ
ncbi:hypothetical protein [Sulfuricurvum sp.]|uniref:hypothetical protein n=1 Tax=Sulfuricurvum sp. TaxID=2025608 RepID=UPI002D65C5AE|nr:hypothetical protein [Sulfuricurvum sp.]HZF69849.1 hypothetical protein [Sulfuricurvum sp.]